jgi:hypothetical protein
MPRSVTFCILTCVLLVQPLSAQARLETGTPIRVVTDSAGVRATIEGTVLSVYPDLLTIDSFLDGTTHTVPVGRVRELYSYLPRSPARSAWRGAQTWGFVGASLGAIGSVGINIALKGDLRRTAAASTVIGLAAGALVGAGAGVILAEAGWQKYQIPPAWRTRPQ